MRGWLAQQTVPDFIITCTDVHDLKNLQEEVMVAKEAAERASRAKSQFLANMSHEIRTPLGIILGFSEIAAETSDPSAEQQSALNTIRRNALHLAGLVDEILDLSKIEADRLEISRVEVSFEKVLRSAVQAFTDKCLLKGLNFKLEVLTDLPSLIVSDEVRLTQILFNLIGNAVKFTASGEVKLRVGVTPASVLQIDVIDSGIGITSEQEKQLFQVFSQGDASITRRFGGSGLGLALSRKLATALGGELALIPRAPGEGSNFRVSLPLESEVGGRAVIPLSHWAAFEKSEKSPLRKSSAQDSEHSSTASVVARDINQNSSSPSKTSGEHLDFRGKRMLVVEDSTDNRFFIQRFIKSTGVEVTIANNGFEGVERAISRSFDLILMDIQMPDMDGVTATKKIRQLGNQVPIVALTAHALKGDHEQCLEAGCSDYPTKPIHKELLLNMMKQFLK